METQEERIRAFAKSQGWELTGVKIDSGLSGANIKKRVSLVGLIQDIKKGRVDKVIEVKLAKALGCEVDDIFPKEDAKNA